MSASAIFLIVFIIFVAILVFCGIYSKKWVSEAADFVLAGREVSTPINTMGVIAIGFAGTTVALAPSFTMSYGLGGSLAWGLIYGICGLLLYGVLWGGFVRKNGAQTLPEFLEMRYDSKIRPIIAITSVIGMCGILANNIVSCVSSIVGFTGWNQTIVMAVIFLVIICFTFISGLWAATITDFFQVVLGIVVVPTVLILLMQRYGGFDAIQANWPSGNWIANGISGMSVPGASLKYPSIFNFVICFAAALVWGNNYYWMKIASCRSEKVAKRSFVLAAILLSIIFTVPFGILGGYVGAFHGDLFTVGGGTIAPTAAYGFIASTFVPLLGSIFVVGACAASISTASTSALGASAVASRDIYQRLINPKATPKQTLKMSKIFMIAIGAFTWILCQFPGGATYLFAFANCWLIPPAILLLLGAIWPKFNAMGAKVGAIIGIVTMVVFTFTGTIFKVFDVGQYIYLASLGFIVTLVAAIVGSFFGKKKYYGEKGWERVPTATNRIDVTLDETDKTVLDMLYIGHCYMADITDALGVDSKTSAASVEKLDQGGYLVRKGMLGSAFYTFSITEKGIAAVGDKSETEAAMAKECLNPMYVELLNIVKNDPTHQADFVKKYSIKSMHMAAISSHLTRQGYIKEKGLFKRKLQITDKGITAVAKFAN